MPSLFYDIVLSLITGIVSGLASAALYDRLGRKNRFYDDQQLYAKYIFQVKAALAVTYSEKDTSTIRLALEHQPILKNIHTRSFKNRKDDKLNKSLLEIGDCLDEVENEINVNGLLQKPEFDYQRRLGLGLLSFLKIKY